MKIRPGSSIWESGIGCGHNAGYFFEKDSTLTVAGVDIAESAVQYSTKNVAPGK